MPRKTRYFSTAVVGLLGAVAITMTGWKLVRNAGLTVASLAFVVDHGTNIFIEGFLTSFYRTGCADIVVTALQLFHFLQCLSS